MVEPASILSRVGRRVRRLRSEQGLTLKELAARSRLSPRFVSQLEGGTANIALGRLAGVAEALGVPLDELVAEYETHTRLRRLLEGLSPPELERALGAVEAALARPRLFVGLLGLRGAGKSTLGPQLGDALGLPFIELDERIEAAAGLSLSELFALHGEPYYRRLEGQCLEVLIAEGRSAVVALPGGVVHNAEAFARAQAHATLVWLRATPEDHMQRVLAQGDRRPMAGSSDAMQELRAILAAREPLYRQAEVTLDTSAAGSDGLRLLMGQLQVHGWSGGLGDPPPH